MFKIIKYENSFYYYVKDRLEFICKYAKQITRFFNGYVI